MPFEARTGAVFCDEVGDAGALLDLTARRPAWHADAACREHPELSWFPGQGESGDAAKAICAGCLVAVDCGAWAAGQDRLVGIWGGLSGAERRHGVRSTERPGRQLVASCTRCEDGRICEACRDRSAYRRKTDAEMYPATAALLPRLGVTPAAL